MRQVLEMPAGTEGDLWRYRNLGRANAMHHHAELEFNLIARGAGLYLLANRRYHVRRGDLLWLFPAQEHVLIEQTLDFEMWVGVLRPSAVRRLAADPGARVLRRANPAGDFCRRLQERDFGRLDALFGEIEGSRGSTPLFNAGLAFALLSAWSQFERAADIPVRDVHPAVENAARLIRDEASPLGLRELAARSGLSAPRLSRLFRLQTGMALVEFRNRQRLERFFRLYGTGQRLTMLEAALEAGFGSYPQFHRVFRRATGCSPGRRLRRMDAGP